MDLSDLFSFEIKSINNKRLQRLLFRKLGTGQEFIEELGTVEKLAFKSALVLNSVNPRLRNPTILVFASDHGVSKALASFLRDEQPTEVNLQSFLQGTLLVNSFSKSSDISVKVVDVGVDHSFEGTLDYWLHHGSMVIDRKQAFGTRNFQEFPAITTAELHSCMQVGMEMVDKERKTGCNVIGFGELARGAKFSAWCTAAALLDKPITDLLSGEPEELTLYLDKALKTHPKSHDVYTILSLYGGYELGALVAAILRAAQHRMLVLIDGLVTATAALAASKLSPNILDYCIFTYRSNDPIHREVLNELKADSLLEVSSFSGMGAGVAYTYPLLKNAMTVFGLKK